MLIYLDSVVLIYSVEGEPARKKQVTILLADLLISGNRLAISDLCLLECYIRPIRDNNQILISEFDRSLSAPLFLKLPISSEVFQRATYYRASHRLELADALHLATAVLGGCEKFLTNDKHLCGKSIPEIVIELLPEIPTIP